MVDDTLRGRIEAELDRREARATEDRNHGWCRPYAEWTLAQCAAARRVLARHRAIEWYEGDVGCWYCSGETDSSHRAVEWPCPDVLDLADSLGLSTTSEEQPT